MRMRALDSTDVPSVLLKIDLGHGMDEEGWDAVLAEAMHIARLTRVATEDHVLRWMFSHAGQACVCLKIGWLSPVLRLFEYRKLRFRESTCSTCVCGALLIFFQNGELHEDDQRFEVCRVVVGGVRCGRIAGGGCLY